MFLVLLIAGGAGPAVRDSAWHQVAAFYILPFILLTPVNGALSNALPRRWVLLGSAAYACLVTVVLGALLHTAVNPWLACVGLACLMAGHAVYSPTRYALLPAVAQDTAIPLTRVNGWIEMGGSAAVVAGLVLGAALHAEAWHGIPLAVAVAVGLGLVAVLAALPADFPSDVRRPEPPGAALADFFRDAGRVVRDREARWTLLGLAGFLALVVTGSGAIFAYVEAAESADRQAVFSQALVLAGVGVAVGSLLASLQGHPRRALGLVPLGAAGLLVAFAWAAGSTDPRWPALAVGVMGGLINVPLRAAYQETVPADARGNGMAVMNFANYVLTAALALLLVGLVRLGMLGPAGQLGLLAALAALCTAGTWWALLREVLEQFAEILLWPLYRIHGHGPGLAQFPRQGPVLVVANHCAWFDPLWVAKVLPRRVTPMMTSVFYDLPGLHWLMVHVAHAIRVAASTYRREAPELKEAVAALDRGELVLLFPEGYMRRKEDRLVKRFGQGLWHILNERPQTPVVACWIEGGWGSYASYKNGPPTKNKRFDLWRRIDVAVSEPQVLDPALLADQRETRTHLERAVVEARRILGLDVPIPDTQSEADEESDGDS
jgi:1-acyl-sn-glycerol-3-phosphate acyltransferase/MFS family permease